MSRHLLATVLPYFAFSWILLSVILFFQQASRYSDIFFSVSIPRSLVLQLTFALIPNVIAFTCPMAALVGVIIGLSKLQGDSELVAMRAAGVGNLSLTVPMIALGIVLSVFALFVNIKGVPFAAGVAKRVGIQSALFKLESPIEPGVFNTGIAGLTVFVRDGDATTGVWRQLFIFNEPTPGGSLRLITASLGRVDTSETRSELVLSDAVVMTLPGIIDGAEAGFSSERIQEVRFAINTGRADLIDKMQKVDEGPEALGLTQLAELARTAVGKDRLEAEILWGRRVILSITPLLFAILGASMVLRFNRGGKGFGIVLALGALIAYYLITLLSEQVTRTTGVSTMVTGLIPIAACMGVSAWFFVSNRYFVDLPKLRFGWRPKLPRISLPRFLKSDRPSSAASRLLDRDIVGNIIRYFLLTLGFLGSIYLIFTAFDMWKFAGTTEGGVVLLAKYLFFLVPMIYIQLAPPALMIAVLATFVIKSRQNEIVTWIAAGQSIYRLLAPCLLLMVVIGIGNTLVQELVLPGANKRQDAFRAQLRSRGIPPTSGAKSWAATDNRIYSFDTPFLGGRSQREVTGLTVFEFNEAGRLDTVYRAPSGLWMGDTVVIDGDAERISFDGADVRSFKVTQPAFEEPEHPFSYANQRPGHLNTMETLTYLSEIDSPVEYRNIAVALHKKYTTLFLPFMIVLFTAPFGLSLGRKGKVVTVGYAVAVWLVYMGLGNLFEQFGLSGAIPASTAVWLPIGVFAFGGVALLSRVRT